MSDRRLSFAEFGERFMAQVVTPELLAREVRASIPKGGLEAVEEVSGRTVEYRAAVESIEAERGDVQSPGPQFCLWAYAFRLRIAVRLTLTIRDVLKPLPLAPDVDETFDLAVQIPLDLEFQLLEPLRIHIGYTEVQPSQVELTIEKAQWHDLSVRFGGLEDKVRTLVAHRVNDLLVASEKVRNIDLILLVNQLLANGSLTGTGEAAPVG